MAKRGFKVMDSDIRVTEPPDLWLKYLEPKFKDRRLSSVDGMVAPAPACGGSKERVSRLLVSP